MNPDEVQWSRNYFNILSLNAIWGVPRSGLIFKKASRYELALHDLMPWSEEMGQGYRDWSDDPISAHRIRLYRQADFETIAQRFTAAGVNVTDPRGLLKD